MIKKIALLETASDIPNIYSYIATPRLGVPILGSLLRQEGYEVTIFSEKIRKPTVDELLAFDLIGISSLTNSSTRGYRYADALRGQRTVVIGGPHGTFLPEESLDHCDYVVRGEAEETLPELIRALNGQASLSTIRGLSYRNGGGVVHNENRAFSEEYLHVSPDLTLVKGIDDFKRGLVSRFLYTPMVHTSRGCPFTCRFCTVIKLAGRKMRYRDVDRCLEEIKTAQENISVRKSIMIVDDNFTVNMKRAKELLRGLIDLGKPDHVLYNIQLRVESFKDEEFLELLNRAGFGLLHVGFESISKKTLDELGKKLGVDQIQFVADQARKFGLKVNGLFIVGTDADTEETVRETVRCAIELDLAVMQLFVLCPLPGSDVYHQMETEKRIFTRNWKYYDCHHVVFFPRNIRPSALQRAVREANRKFYAPRRLFLNHAPGNRLTCGMAIHSMARFQKAYEKKLEQFEERFYGSDGILIPERLEGQAEALLG